MEPLAGHDAPDLATAIDARRAAAERFVVEDDGLTAEEAALTLAVVGLFPDRAAGVNSRRLWRRALTIACAARSIAEEAGVDPVRAFRCGLLRDVGWFVLATLAPLACVDAVERAAADEATLDAALFDACGAGLHEAGTWLRERWGIEDDDAGAAAATLAAWLVDLKRMRLPGEEFDPRLDEEVWTHLALDPEGLVDLTEGLTDDADRARRLYRAARENIS